MRNLVFAIFTTFLCFSLSAQESSFDEFEEETMKLPEIKWAIGPSVGIGFSTTRPESKLIYLAQEQVAYQIDFLGNSTSKSIGIDAHKAFEFAFIEIGAYYTSLSSSYNVLGYGEKDKTSSVFNESYRNAEIAVLGGGKYNRFNLGVGPIIRYNLSTTTDFSELLGYKMKDSQINLGSQAAFGVDLGIFHVDVRYIQSFEAIGSRMSFGGNFENGFKSRPSEIKLTIGTSF